MSEKMYFLLNCIITGICFNLQHMSYCENAHFFFYVKSAVISNIESYIYVHMYDLVTQINLIFSLHGHFCTKLLPLRDKRYYR